MRSRSMAANDPFRSATRVPRAKQDEPLDEDPDEDEDPPDVPFDLLRALPPPLPLPPRDPKIEATTMISMTMQKKPHLNT
mmetsp:Transcript_15258/g.51304  ORF Transcript_15258/g.51304 Transcript_15258/m.51304 type:complete len:80 (-) Transcript_15258:615-854(-)